MNEEKLVLRDYSPSEYDSLAGMWAASGLPFKPEGRDSREMLKAELERGPGEMIVAELDGDIVGSVLVTHDGRKGWINRLAVIPAVRGSGIGEKLVREGMKRLDREGIEITAALIEGDNPTSRRLLKKLGFEEHRDIVYYSWRKHPGV